MARYGIFCVSLLVLLFLGASFSNRLDNLASGGVAAQATCNPPIYQGYPSTCANLVITWLPRDNSSLIDHFEIYRGGFKVATLPGTAKSYPDPVGCNFAAVYTIRQVMKSGASCSTVTDGNPPHTRPCDLCTGNAPVLNVVTSASYSSPVMPNSVATIFASEGQTFTSTTAAATSLPLPTTLGGARVQVEDVQAQLFYVSPTQINFLMPGIHTGTIRMAVLGPNGERVEGVALTGPNPAIFTANATGKGVAAALVTSDGNNYQRIFDASGNAVPVGVTNAGQPNYLVLFGTGLRNQLDVQIKINGQPCIVTFAGPHPQMPGIDQINVQMPLSQSGAGLSYIYVLAGGIPGNFPQIYIGN